MRRVVVYHDGLKICSSNEGMGSNPIAYSVIGRVVYGGELKTLWCSAPRRFEPCITHCFYRLFDHVIRTVASSSRLKVTFTGNGPTVNPSWRRLNAFQMISPCTR